jgi:hypothetical protein
LVPADQQFSLTIGQDGLNLRDQPAEVPVTQIIDGLNWRIDENGALVKRLGYVSYGTLPALPLAQFTYAPVSGTTSIIFYCADGFVYTSPGDGSFTAIAGGLSTTAAPSFTVINDKLYWSNGVDPVQQWDGSTLTAITGVDDVQTISITGTPTGGTWIASLNGASSSAIAYNASASTLQTALQLVATIGAGNVVCTGGPLPGTPIVCTFVNALANQALPLIITTDSFTGGSTPATHVNHTTTGRGDAPRGLYLAEWRNRLFVCGSNTYPNRVWWSGAGDATVWTATNFVDILGPADQITGATAAPNIATSFDGADGILIYKRRSLHRITDDSDNVGGVITGGANVLVDTSTGTLSATSIVHQNGRVYAVAQNGIYSTDGHTAQRLESTRLGPFFPQSLPVSQLEQAVGADFRGTILYAIPDVTANEGTLTLEVSTGLVAADRSHPIMALDLPIAYCSVFPQTTGQDLLIFCDSSQSPTDDRLQARTYPNGGADTKQTSNTQPITAYARSGATVFSTPKPKRFRRLQVTGRGSLLIGVEADLETGPGESQTVNLLGTSTVTTGGGGSGSSGTWGDGGLWGDGRIWGTTGGGGGGPVTTTLSTIQTGSAWYTRRGRRFSFYISHTGTDAGATTGSLGAPVLPTGGAAVFDLTARITPLEGEA